MIFLADNCLDRKIVQMLRYRGHEVIVLTDLIPADSPDPSVAQLAIANNATLITHDNDFKSQQSRAKGREREAYKTVHLLLLCQMHTGTAPRFAQVVELVEAELSVAHDVGIRPYIQVLPDRVVIYR